MRSNCTLFRSALLGSALLLAAFAPLSAAQVAPTYDIIYSFRHGPAGNFPDAELTLDSAGNLYGVTAAGGANGYGTVFKLTPKGEENRAAQ